MKALIDGDIIVYSCGFATEGYYYEVTLPDGETVEVKYKKDAEALSESEGGSLKIEKCSDPEPVSYCLNTVNKLLTSILEKFQTHDYVVYLTGKGNFREELSPEYKANRKDTPKPTHYQAIRDYLVDHWDAVVVEGQEADDALAIEQWYEYAHRWPGKATKEGMETVIASKDKDLDMVPGWHYNFTKDDLYWVSEEEGIRSFYKQILTGDSVDNIPGIKGIGPRKAEKILEGCNTEKEMWDEVLLAHIEDYIKKHDIKEGGLQTYEVNQLEQEVIRNARLLWMRREENEEWQPPSR